ncbi:MAG: transglycosylase [Ruminococcaceae bacterium]|nr:transglycosylase [Oscillospiraceae bacterium]
MEQQEKKDKKSFASAVGAFFGSKAMRIVGSIFGWIGKILATILLIGIITGCIAGCIMTIYVFKTFSASPEVPDITQIMDNGTSIIYTQDANGEWVENQRLEGINRIWTDFNDIPDYLQKAVVAIEDERYYLHKGVDWKRTAAAVVNQVLGGDSQFGGSTITQQLIKVVSGDDETSIERKIREIFRALEMERDYYTKDEILEAYLNILPLSDGVVGVGAAANYYFAKDVEDLTLAECALIAGVTNLPSYYDPYDHPDHAKKRQETILGKMHELGFISDDEYIQAYNEELHYKSNARYIEVQDYYVDTLIEDVIGDLMEKYGYNYTYAEQLVFFGGLRIYSYEDVNKQRAVEAVMRDDANFIDYEEEDENPNAAVFIMDYEGRVVAVVGGRGEKSGNRVQNNATQSQRQPGSTMKPLGVYAPAMDQGLINYSTIVRDAPITLPDGTLWPPNYGNSSAYDTGKWMTVQYALQESKNTVPVRILDEMGFETSYNFLKEKLHFTSLVESDYAYAPLALGGMTYGVTVREMCAGYQIFGNAGIFNSPHTYNRVENEEGEVLLEHVLEEERVIEEDTATVMNRILQTVTSYGTAAEVSGDWSSIQLFSKTGTTDNNKDAYFAGGTPYYVGALWMGYDSNQISLSYDQRMSSKYLFSKCMKALHADLPAATFDKWGDVEGHYYDPEFGVVVDESETGEKENKWGYYKADDVPRDKNYFGDEPYMPTTTTTTTTTTAKKTTTTTKAKATTTTVETTTTTDTEVTDPTGEGETTTLPEGETTTLPVEGETTTLPEGETTAPPPDPTDPTEATTTTAPPAVVQNP